jgi:hypothetical protein
MTIDNRPILQKLHNMSKLKVVMIMNKEAMGEIQRNTRIPNRFKHH